MEKLQDEKLKKILMELAEMLREVYRDKLKAVILYGSVARGMATVIYKVSGANKNSINLMKRVAHQLVMW